GLRAEERITFAGQITGVEGYIESAASGILAGVAAASGRTLPPPPPETMLGALCGYISDPSVENFQPMGSNMGILPPLPEIVKSKEARYLALAERALAAAQRYAAQNF
ncbi:MAG: FAD-dependent oxidoreductase, partial [Angelakisella sp.]